MVLHPAEQRPFRNVVADFALRILARQNPSILTNGKLPGRFAQRFDSEAAPQTSSLGRSRLGEAKPSNIRKMGEISKPNARCNRGLVVKRRSLLSCVDAYDPSCAVTE